MIARYLVFGSLQYYPCGGWDDFKGAYPTLEEGLIAAANLRMSDWWQIVDLESGTMVRSGVRV